MPKNGRIYFGFDFITAYNNIDDTNANNKYISKETKLTFERLTKLISSRIINELSLLLTIKYRVNIVQIDAPTWRRKIKSN